MVFDDIFEVWGLSVFCLFWLVFGCWIDLIERNLVGRDGRRCA